MNKNYFFIFIKHRHAVHNKLILRREQERELQLLSS